MIIPTAIATMHTAKIPRTSKKNFMPETYGLARSTSRPATRPTLDLDCPGGFGKVAW